MLFENEPSIGFFRGYKVEGLEPVAEIIVGHAQKASSLPELGSLVLIELGSDNEALLCRIASVNPTGILTSSRGEDYLNTIRRRGHQAPEDLLEQRAKYLVLAKIMGTLRYENGTIKHVPTARRLPLLGARVQYANHRVIQSLITSKKGQTILGRYALGECVYDGGETGSADPDVISLSPNLPVTFDVETLISRRSAVFARAGYGKSNLIKYLVSELCRHEPKNSLGLPVGTLIIDAEGEYFFPDTVKGRPGLCDVPHLKDNLVVFTNRIPPNDYYGSWKVGDVKLDIRTLRPSEIVPLVIPKDRLDQQNVAKLMAMKQSRWARLVELASTNNPQFTDDFVLTELLVGTPFKSGKTLNSQELNAARSNVNRIVHNLHAPESNLIPGVMQALAQGKIVVIDISLLSRSQGEMVAGILLRHVFRNNQLNFTAPNKRIIPTIAIIEEAQTVLADTKGEDNPFVEWVKEGRKYELGAIMVTQQPSSLPPEILSQTDNWFAFHLLADEDAYTLNRFNSFYSQDILSKLVGEPIRGNCFFWSSYANPFVVSLRVEDFQGMYKKNVLSTNDLPAVDTYAKRLKEGLHEKMDSLLERFRTEVGRRHLKRDFDMPYSSRNRNQQQTPTPKMKGFFEKDLLHVLSSIIKDDDFIFETEESLLVRLISKRNPDFQIIETPEGTAYCFPS